ncbi:hypothetical protein SLA2020_437620 [Shorea laevis]
MRLQVEDGGNATSSERSDYDDENGLATGDEYDDNVMDDYAPPYNGRSDDLLQGTYYNVDVEEEEEEEDEDEDDDDEDGDGDNNEGDAEDVQGDVDMEEYINGDSEEEGNGYGDGEQNVDQDEAAGYTSSDYSE